MKVAARFDHDRHETQKQTLLKWSCFLWIVFGGYLFTVVPGAELYSLPSLAYFTVGLTAAAILFGGGTWLAGFVLAALATRLAFDTGRATTWAVAASGIGVLIGEACLMYLTARAIITAII